MGSVDGSTGDPGSVLRRANLFSADSEPMTPVNVGEDGPAAREQNMSATPSFDMALSSVERRVAAVKLTGEDGAAASPGAAADASCANGDEDAEDVEVCPAGAGGADADDVKIILDDAAPSPAAEGRSAAAAGESAGQAKQWLEPPSPAVAPPLSSKHAAGKSTFSMTPKEPTSTEVSPYGARSRNGGGPSTSSTFGVSSDDEDDVMAAFAGGGGGAVAEMTLPKLPRVEETLPAQPQPTASSSAAAAADAAEDGDGETVPGLRDVAGGNSISAVDAESSTILDDMLQHAASLRASGNLVGADPGAGAGPADAAPSSASDAARAPAGGKGKGGAAVLSAVEKEAMALAAACVAEQEAINKAPEAEDAGIEAIAGEEQGNFAADAELEVAKEEPEVTGEENGDGDGETLSASKGTADTAGRGRRPTTPGKPAAASAVSVSTNAEKKVGSSLKMSSVSISRVGLPAAVSARRGSTSGGGSRRNSISTRPESPARVGATSRSPPPSGLRRASPSPARRSSGIRPPSPSTATRRQSMAFGSRVSSSDATGAATAAKKLEAAEPAGGTAPAATAAAAKRATSRGRDRGARERTSVGGFGFGRGRDVGTGGAAAAAAAAVAGESCFEDYWGVYRVAVVCCLASVSFGCHPYPRQFRFFRLNRLETSLRTA